MLQWAARIAGVLLVPLIGLALWGIALRIGQHGLTPERIIATACVLVGAVHAVGYALAAVKPGPWMRPLERANVIGGVVAVAAILALFTPLADPARLSVADQMRRLETGRVSAEAFDYHFLRFDAGRSGLEALDRLAASDDPEIVRRAAEAKAALSRYRAPEPTRPAFVTPHPEDAVIPEDFLARVSSDFGNECRRRDDCVATMRDLDSDGVAEILMANRYRIAVFERGEDSWSEIGQFHPHACRADLGDPREILRGNPAMVPSTIHDMQVGDVRLPLQRDMGCVP